MSNLKHETINKLSEYKYQPEDIKAVGGHDFRIAHEAFWNLADTEYDSDFGAVEVAEDLTLWMDDGGVFYRHEYDGSEKWMYIPPIPERAFIIDALTKHQAKVWLAGSLAEVNDPEYRKACADD